jgi:hypothetical protein
LHTSRCCDRGKRKIKETEKEVNLAKSTA